MKAYLDSKPNEIAQRFCKEQGVDTKYEATLKNLIEEQLNLIINGPASPPK